jgi:hypothetical protein
VATIDRVVIDYETAYAKGYRVETSDSLDGPWRLQFEVAENAARLSAASPAANVSLVTSDSPSQPDDKHVVHTVSLTRPAVVVGATPLLSEAGGRYVRLYMHTKGRPWAFSVWRMEIWGHPRKGVEAGSCKKVDKKPDLRSRFS